MFTSTPKKFEIEVNKERRKLYERIIELKIKRSSDEEYRAYLKKKCEGLKEILEKSVSSETCKLAFKNAKSKNMLDVSTDADIGYYHYDYCSYTKEIRLVKNLIAAYLKEEQGAIELQGTSERKQKRSERKF